MDIIGFDIWCKNRYSKYTSTAQQYINFYNMYVKEFEDDNITQERFEVFVNKHPHGLCRAFLKNLAEYRKVKDIDIPKYKSRDKNKEQKKRRFLTIYEINKIIQHFNHRHELKGYTRNNPKMAIITCILFETGLRRKELMNIRKKDIDMLHNKISGIGKGNKPYEVIFSNKIKYWLQKFINSFSSEDYIFRFKGVKNQEKKIWYELMRAGKELDITPLHPHRLRHALGHWLRTTKSWDLEQIREYLRHEDISSTSIYTKATKEEVLDKINNEFNTSESKTLDNNSNQLTNTNHSNLTKNK